VPDEIRRNVELWIGCVAGALQESEYRAKLESAGFKDITVQVTRTYGEADAAESCLQAGDKAALTEGKFASAFIRARKSGSLDSLPARSG